MKCVKILFMMIMYFSICFTSEENLRVGNRIFSVKFLQELLKRKPNENIIFSPITVQILMSLLITATNRTTPAMKEIINILKLPSTKAARERAFKDLLDDFKFKDDDFKFFDANKIYFSTETSVKDWFNNTSHDIYKADTEIIDFLIAKNAADTINNWVANRTNNNIVNFIPPEELSTQTKMLMINALYLKGKWTVPFLTEDTVNDTFMIPTEPKTVEMMNTNKKKYEYFEDANFQYLKLDILRANGDASVVFVLPEFRSGVSSSKVIEENLKDALSKHTFQKLELTTVSLPKFKFEKDLELTSILQKLGVKKIFNQNGALLEGFNTGGTIHHTISEFFQKALIEINEFGVKAITTAKIATTVDDNPQLEEKEFIADHPFLFYITVADVIVYAGFVVEP